MQTYKVSELAAMAQISVRTLHHYHDIGLLVPARVGSNGYRYYDQDQLLRLQQILIYRELGVSLADMGAMLDSPEFDRLETLRSQRRRVSDSIARSNLILRTIDHTIAHLEGRQNMSSRDLYSGIVDKAKQEEYERWLSEKYGPEIAGAIEDGRTRMANLSQADIDAKMAELKAIETDIAAEMLAGTAPNDGKLDPLIEKHRLWVEGAAGGPTSAAYAGLADVYEHPDFEARYEKIAKGFGAFLRAAMRAWAARQSSLSA